MKFRTGFEVAQSALVIVFFSSNDCQPTLYFRDVLIQLPSQSSQSPILAGDSWQKMISRWLCLIGWLWSRSPRQEEMIQVRLNKYMTSWFVGIVRCCLICDAHGVITCLCNTHKDSGIGLHHESWWDCIGLHYQSCWDCIGLHYQSCWDCIGLHYESCWDCIGIAMGLNLGGITMRSDSVGLPKESWGWKYNSK